MATIARYPFISHLRATQTSYVHHLVRGRRRHAAIGSAFWFRPLTSAVSEVPVDNRERPILVSVRTRDLQQVSVPGVITYRVGDPELAVSRVDFSLNLRTGFWNETPLEALGAVVHAAAAEAVTGALRGLDLHAVLGADLQDLAGQVKATLSADDRVNGLGIEVVGVSLAMVRPEPDVERALQTPARETIQQEADRATFERRALAVEREAAIGENELANQIELAKRRENLIAQDGVNQRRVAEEKAAAARIDAESEADRERVRAEARADADRAVGQAAADTEQAKVAAYADVPRELLLALAVREAAEHLPAIDHLVITPDLVQGLLSKLTVDIESKG